MSLPLVFSKTGKSDSQGHSVNISIERMSEPLKELFFISAGKWDSACAKTHFVAWGDFAFDFLQNYVFSKMS